MLALMIIQFGTQCVEARWEQTYMTGEWVQCYDTAEIGSYSQTFMEGDWVSTYDN